MRWPLGIGLGLALVVMVDFAFIWIAGQHAPDIEPSYEASQER